MKLIKPQPLDAQKISSNASADGIAAWQAQGLDRLGSLTGIVACIVDNFLYFTSYIGVSSGKNTIRRQDLSNGTISGTIASFDGDPVQLEVSPDGTKAALTRVNALGPGIEVFNLSTGAVLFKREGNVEAAGPIAWAPDSLTLAYTERRTTPGSNYSGPHHAVNLVDFLGTAYIKQTLYDYPDNSYAAYPILSLDYNSDGRLFALFDLPGINAADDNWLDWWSPTGTGSALKKVPSPSLFFGDISFMLLNRAANELLFGFSTGIQVFDLSTQTDNGGVSTEPSSVIAGQFVAARRSQDNAELYFQAGSTLPQHRRFAAADYTELDAFPATSAEQPIKQMLYGTDYAVFLRNNYPYQIVDRTTNAAISQFNPDVKTGERYTFRDAIWEVLVDNADQPDIGAAANPATWLEVRKTNAVRMIDGKVGSVSTAAGPFVIDILPATAIDGLALFNLSGSAVTVEIHDPALGLVYTSGRRSLVDNSVVTDWYEYFFAPIEMRTDFVLTNIPKYQGAKIRVIIQDTGGTSQVGELIVGTVYDIGDTQFGYRTGLIDFSRKERDAFGNFEVIERDFSKRAEFPISLLRARAPSVQSLLASVRATPAVYIGDESSAETLLLGFFKSLDLIGQTARYSHFALEVEGLI